MDAYAFDPYHIRRVGLGRFKNTMRRQVGARTTTLEHLFERAKESVGYHKTEAELKLLVERLKALWADFAGRPFASRSRQSDVSSSRAGSSPSFLT